MGVFLPAFTDDAALHGWATAKATKRSGPTVYFTTDLPKMIGADLGHAESF